MLGNLATQIAENANVEARLLSQLMQCGFPDAIFFKDARRRYICLNEMECQLLGVAAPDDVVGKTADRLVSAKRARLWRREEAEVLVTGVALIDRVEAVERADGTIRWLSSTKAPIRNQAGDVTGLVGITRDITHHKLQENLKEQFVATISHELRTPVTSIMGSLALVASGATGVLPEPARRLLEIARANSQRLVSLINDILDLEKVAVGHDGVRSEARRRAPSGRAGDRRHPVLRRALRRDGPARSSRRDRDGVRRFRALGAGFQQSPLERRQVLADGRRGRCRHRERSGPRPHQRARSRTRNPRVVQASHLQQVRAGQPQRVACEKAAPASACASSSRSWTT